MGEGLLGGVGAPRGWEWVPEEKRGQEVEGLTPLQ